MVDTERMTRSSLRMASRWGPGLPPVFVCRQLVVPTSSSYCMAIILCININICSQTSSRHLIPPCVHDSQQAACSLPLMMQSLAEHSRQDSSCSARVPFLRHILQPCALGLLKVGHCGFRLPQARLPGPASSVTSFLPACMLMLADGCRSQ